MADSTLGFVIVAMRGEVRAKITDQPFDKYPAEEYLPGGGWHVAASRMLPNYRGTALLASLADMTANEGDDDTLHDALVEIVLEAFRAGREYERRDPVTITPDPEAGSNLFEVECLRCGEDYTARGEEEANAHARSHRAECAK